MRKSHLETQTLCCVSTNDATAYSFGLQGFASARDPWYQLREDRTNRSVATAKVCQMRIERFALIRVLLVPEALEWLLEWSTGVSKVAGSNRLEIEGIGPVVVEL